MPLVEQESPVQPFMPEDEPSGRPPVSLDASEQKFAELCAGERACQWAKGDEALKALSAAKDRKARSAVLGRLAMVGHCSKGYVGSLADVARQFGREDRRPDVAWSLYRSCMQAVGRYQSPWDASGLLAVALQNGWHCKEVNALGKPDREPASTLKATCGDCGAKVSVTIAGMGGVDVPCPVCEGVKYEEKHERPMVTLGTLS